MNIQVHDTTGASLYELVFSHKARTVIFPTQQNAIVLEENLADEGIDVGISSEQATVISTSQHQAFRSEEDANTDVEQDAQCSMKSSHQGSTTQNVVNEAEDTLHAEVSAAESETIEREVLEKNDDDLNGNELKCNGKRKCLREDALSTSLKHKKVKLFWLCLDQCLMFLYYFRSESKPTESTFLLPRRWQKDTTNNTAHCHL